jgi:hypothetical protein
MNYAESFEQFSNRVSPTDLMLYAGAALVLYVLFQDKLGGVKNWVYNLYDAVMSKFKKDGSVVPSVVSPAKSNNDFLNLVKSWKGTRDLAENAGCKEAVKILDSAFPHLGPHNCVDDNGEK